MQKGPLAIYFLLNLFLNPFILLMGWVYDDDSIACKFGSEYAPSFVFGMVIFAVILNLFVLLYVYREATSGFSENRKASYALVFVLYGLFSSWFLFMHIMVTDKRIHCEFDSKIQGIKVKRMAESRMDSKDLNKEIKESIGSCREVGGRFLSAEDRNFAIEYLKEQVPDRGILLSEDSEARFRAYRLSGEDLIVSEDPEMIAYFICILN